MTNQISIVIPARNEAHFLANLLTILCEQFGNNELIVINNGSTDETVKVYGKYPLKLVSHPNSTGNGAAIKAG